MIHWTTLLAAEIAEGGGLFDINATLPLMAIQFLILVAILNILFYKPIGKAIDDRDNYIRTNIADAEERLAKAETLAAQYESELSDARRQTQEILTAAQDEASKIAADRIAEAQREAQARVEQVQSELNQQKQEAMQSLEQQVDQLTQQIINKLLGSQAA